VRQTLVNLIMPDAESSSATLHGRIRALVYGTAYGDALGAPVGGLSPPAAIRERYGRVTSIDTD